MTNAGIAKRIEKDQPNADIKAADLKASNPDDSVTHEDAFSNLLSQATSTTKNLSFFSIVRPAVAPDTFTDDFG